MSERRKIIFRVDGSTRLGMGHVMRCIRLCEYLKRSIAPEPEVSFAMAEYKGIYKGLDKSLVEKLPFNVGPDRPSSPVEYDLTVFPKTLVRLPHDLLILDCNWEKYPEMMELLPDGLPTISLHEHNFPILQNLAAAINPSIVEQEPARDGNLDVTHFQGPGYLMLDEIITKLARTQTRERTGSAHILLSLGGADPEGYTVNVVEALHNKDDIHLTVIIGPAFPDSVHRRLNEMHGINILYTPPGLAPLLAEADIAIVNGATTMFESLALGVPTIAIPRNPYEMRQAEICTKAGAALMCLPGKINSEIRDQIGMILSEKLLRGNLSAKGRQLIDGKGLSRVGEIVTDVLSRRDD